MVKLKAGRSWKKKMEEEERDIKQGKKGEGEGMRKMWQRDEE